MNIDLTLLGEMLTFMVLVVVTMKYIWPPLTEAIRDRQARISDGLAAAERGQQQLEQAREDAEKILQEAREQASEILAQANKRHSEMLEKSREDARAEGERLVEAARAEIQQEVVRARETLRAELGNLVIDGAERVLAREIDSKAHNDLVDELVEQI
ncbi:MAG TPA: F0F1 ATP synthase subunit B [Gammaproteobacteria bacterium]|nr:F0F1 ATP synthase subunit B [Gammaproteobacteria bacterium]